MTLPTVSPYALSMPGHSPAATQTAVVPPQGGQPVQSAAAKRSFHSFVEAMDDMNFDRRDVAGMRQLLAMQKERQAAAQAAQAPTTPPAMPNVSMFAPQIAQPDVPVVKGPAPATPPVADLAAINPYAGRTVTQAPLPALTGLPQLPGPASGDAQPAQQQSALPSLPTLPQAQPAMGNANLPPAGHVVAYIPMGAQATTAQAGTTQDLPKQLRSPLIDEARAATQSGQRAGLSDEALARFASNRQRASAAPLPPRLAAQEARWNRDPWTASVTAGRAAPQGYSASQPQAVTAQQAASNLPRLPTAPTVE